MARRIQRKRTKGWRMPEGAVYVGRPSKWGNPFGVGAELVVYTANPDGCGGEDGTWTLTAQDAVDLYRTLETTSCHFEETAQRELGGHDLVCWCPLDQPCHADVLLEIANRPG